MELYEAAQLILSEGEILLHEAANFSRKHLIESLEYLDENQSSKVRNTLKHPYHKILPIFMAKSFLKDFEGVFEWIKPLQELAQMEFAMARRIHQQELSQISNWWNNLKFSMDLKLARDQPLKWYTWNMATVTGTGFSELRIELTKAVSFIYLVDDIYDIYGTLDQLILFTEAIKRWESAEIDELPDYMKMCFKALCHFTIDLGYKISTKYGHNPVSFLRNTWESLCDAFLVQVKWFASTYIPKTDEYLETARVTKVQQIDLKEQRQMVSTRSGIHQSPAGMNPNAKNKQSVPESAKSVTPINRSVPKQVIQSESRVDFPPLPSAIETARVSSGVHIWVIHAFFLLGLGATKESAICLRDIAGLTSSISTIFRFYNDLGSAKDGNQDGTDGSYIDCYVHEHSVTVEFAKEHVLRLISNEWVRLNKENHCLCKHAPSFLKASLNFARMMPLMYNYDEDKCLPLLEAHINSIFSDK